MCVRNQLFQPQGMESVYHRVPSRSVCAHRRATRMSWYIPLVDKDSVNGCLGERGGNVSSRCVGRRMFLGNHLMNTDIVCVGELVGNVSSRSVGRRMSWYIPLVK